MELAFLNGILRSPYMPPLDPWFSGGLISYYYYGYIVIAALIKLTGIASTTAFNLAIPTLFALTFTGAFALVYSLSQRLSIALLGGYLVALLGNLDGIIQVLQQYALLWQHQPIPLFNYWQSSRVIPFTINEFPFWSFLFADLHPHVIAMPFSLLLMGLLASLLLTRQKTAPRRFFALKGEGRLAQLLFYLLLAFVFGSIACINPWDMPVCALLLGAALLMGTFYTWREAAPGLRWQRRHQRSPPDRTHRHRLAPAACGRPGDRLHPRANARGHPGPQADWPGRPGALPRAGGGHGGGAGDGGVLERLTRLFWRRCCVLSYCSYCLRHSA